MAKNADGFVLVVPGDRVTEYRISTCFSFAITKTEYFYIHL